MRPLTLPSLALAVALAAAPASAAIMKATYVGHVYDGIDYAGVFGQAGADLAGSAFEFSVTYDTAAGIIGSVNTPGITALNLYTTATAPAVSSTYRIGATTVSPAGLNGYYPFAAQVAHFDAGLGYTASICNYSGASDNSAFAACFSTNDAIPDDLVTPFTATTSTFPSFVQGRFIGGGGPANTYVLYGTPESVVVTKLGDSVAVDTAVPEPETWALMILGFGAAGAGLRRRRREAAPA